MFPKVNQRKFTFDENSQQLFLALQPQSFFNQNNEPKLSSSNQKVHSSLDRRYTSVKSRQSRLKTEASSPKSAYKPSSLGPGQYNIKYDQVQSKAYAAKLYSEPSTINDNEILNKYLNSEFINRKTLVMRKYSREEQNSQLGPGRYNIDNTSIGQKNDIIAHKFSKLKRNNEIQKGQSNGNNQNKINDIKYLDQIDNPYNIAEKFIQQRSPLEELNRIFNNSISVSTQSNNKGRSFSKTPKKLSPRHLDDDKYYTENTYNDIANENPGPGYYEIQSQFDQKIIKKPSPKNYRYKKRRMHEQRYTELLQPLQTPRYNSSLKQDDLLSPLYKNISPQQKNSSPQQTRLDFNRRMQQIKQSLPQNYLQDLQKQQLQVSPQNEQQVENQEQILNYHNLQTQNEQQQEQDKEDFIQNQNKIEQQYQEKQQNNLIEIQQQTNIQYQSYIDQIYQYQLDQKEIKHNKQNIQDQNPRIIQTPLSNVNKNYEELTSSPFSSKIEKYLKMQKKDNSNKQNTNHDQDLKENFTLDPQNNILSNQLPQNFIKYSEQYKYKYEY